MIVTFKFEFFENIRCYIRKKYKSELYDFRFNLPKCEYDFSVYDKIHFFLFDTKHFSNILEFVNLSTTRETK